jgi:hypothetical protein
MTATATPGRAGPRRQTTKWLAAALRAAELLRPICFAARHIFSPAPDRWNPGVTILVLPPDSQDYSPADRMSELQSAAAEVAEPVEILIAHGAKLLDEVHRGVVKARFDWVYLVGADVRIESSALGEALRWRAPHVFAIGSRISGKTEEGWKDVQVAGDVAVPLDVAPDPDGPVRGSVHADPRAALFRRSVLRRVIERRDPYLAPEWNSVEWGIRAWRAGYEVLFCPNSRARGQGRRPTQAAEHFRRDQLQFDMRNDWTGIAASHLLQMTREGAPGSHVGLHDFGNALRVFSARLKAYAAPVRHVPWKYLRHKFYVTPRNPADHRPKILVTAPYAVYPPAHGGARRIHRLLELLAGHYRIVLLSDEARLYGTASQRYFGHLESVHVVEGRGETGTAEPARVARMRNHSHELLGHELDRIVRVHRPDLVQIEHVELALLARWKTRRLPWALVLHDVLASSGEHVVEDRFERGWVSRFDHLVACCEEDASLLPGLRVTVVPNGADLGGGSYVPSTGLSDLLFLGPFRYAPNWEGIQEFLRGPYPRVRERHPDIRIHILGGVGACARAGGCDIFCQPGVYVHDHVDNIAPWLQASALTINPLRGNRGSSLKLIESLAAGRACVSTRDGARGFLDSGLRGLIVVESVSEFGSAIHDLLYNASKRTELEAPDFNCLSRYTWSRSAEQQDSLYRWLIRKRHA